MIIIRFDSIQFKEWTTHCQQLIYDSHDWICRTLEKRYRSPCIFGDIEGVIPKDLYNKSDCFVKKAISINNADVCLTQYCFAHAGQCPLLSSDADIEVAGLPCWDFSMAGKMMMEEGRTNSVFCCKAYGREAGSIGHTGEHEGRSNVETNSGNLVTYQHHPIKTNNTGPSIESKISNSVGDRGVFFGR